MKSLRDEIRTYVRDKEDGFDFIVSEANDFIRASRGFHRDNGAISLKNELCRRANVQNPRRRLRLDPRDAHRFDQHVERKQPGLKKYIFML